jgi:hypothetical protein
LTLLPEYSCEEPKNACMVEPVVVAFQEANIMPILSSIGNTTRYGSFLYLRSLLDLHSLMCLLQPLEFPVQMVIFELQPPGEGKVLPERCWGPSYSFPTNAEAWHKTHQHHLWYKYLLLGLSSVHMNSSAFGKTEVRHNVVLTEKEEVSSRQVKILANM